jgi:hypothetical protein
MARASTASSVKGNLLSLVTLTCISVLIGVVLLISPSPDGSGPSVDPYDSSQETVARVALMFTYEDGEWRNRFSQEEYDLFMPDASYEEFVKVQ